MVDRFWLTECIVDRTPDSCWEEPGCSKLCCKGFRKYMYLGSVVFLVIRKGPFKFRTVPFWFGTVPFWCKNGVLRNAAGAPECVLKPNYRGSLFFSWYGVDRSGSERTRSESERARSGWERYRYESERARSDSERYRSNSELVRSDLNGSGWSSMSLSLLPLSLLMCFIYFSCPKFAKHVVSKTVAIQTNISPNGFNKSCPKRSAATNGRPTRSKKLFPPMALNLFVDCV